MATEPKRTPVPTTEPKKDESGPVLSDRAKTRAERFRVALDEVLVDRAETLRKLAQ